MQAQRSNQLPDKTIMNPKGPNVNAIFLRSIKSAELVVLAPEISNKVVEPTIEPTPRPDYEVVVDTEKEKNKEYVPPLPFP